MSRRNRKRNRKKKINNYQHRHIDTGVKVKIIKAEYDEQRDLVLWLIEHIESGKQKTLAYKGIDLHNAFGFTKPFTPDLIRFFCKEIEGKVKTFMMQQDIRSLPKTYKTADVDHADDVLSSYPFSEVMDWIKERDEN